MESQVDGGAPVQPQIYALVHRSQSIGPPPSHPLSLCQQQRLSTLCCMSYVANNIGIIDMLIAHILRLIEQKGVEAIEEDEVEVKGFTKVDNEFKRTLRRAVVCLANTSGGQIILGVDETTDSVEGCPDIDQFELTNIVSEG